MQGAVRLTLSTHRDASPLPPPPRLLRLLNVGGREEGGGLGMVLGLGWGMGMGPVFLVMS